MKNWKKHLSHLFSLLLLVSTFSQSAVPLIAYGETMTDDPAATVAEEEEENVDLMAELDAPEELEEPEEAALILTVAELGEHEGNAVVIKNVEITHVETDEEVTLYTAVNEAKEEFFIRDEANILGLEIGATYAALTGVVSLFDDTYQITPSSIEDLVIAEPAAPEEDLQKDEPAGEMEVEEAETDPADGEDAAEAVEAVENETGEEAPVEEDENEENEEEEASEEIAATQALVAPMQAAESFELSLMHMNDTHARVPNYANMLTAIHSFRAENPDSLLLHAGDVFSGTLYFNEFQGEADLALLNLMGIDAFAFGNHEFDLGNSPEGHTALGNFVAGANFPFLGTNIDFSADPIMAPLDTNATLVSDPAGGQIYNSLVLDVNGEQVGVFGLTTEDTSNIASPGSIAFLNYITAAEQAVAEFEAAGIDKIIAVTHLGYASSPTYGNDIVLANQVDGIDIIVGGHSHTALSAPDFIEAGESPTVIVQAGANADNLGTLNVTFNEAGEITEYNGALLPVGNYDPDPTAVAALAEYQEAIDEINNEETGAVALRDLENPRHNEDSDTNSVRANETPLGNLVTDAMLAKTQELYPDAVMAVQNGGGIRAPIAEGPITVGEVINVLPFGNNPVVVEMTGLEIKEIFEIAYGANQRPAGGLEENGGFLHVSGATIYFDSTRPAGDRVVGIFIERNGERVAVAPNESYLITTNAFTGQGGDSLTPFAQAYAEGRVQDTGAIDWEQLRDYMVEEEYLAGEVDPVLEGRIVDLMGEDLPMDPEEPTDPAEEIAELERRISELEEAINTVETDNETLLAELDTLRELLSELQAELDAGETSLEELEQRLAELEARFAALEEEVGAEPTIPVDPSEPEKPGDPDSTPPASPDEGGLGEGGTPGRPSDRMDADGKPLPRTGTATENFAIIGVIVLAAGGMLYVISKRKTSER